MIRTISISLACLLFLVVAAQWHTSVINLYPARTHGGYWLSQAG